MQENEFNPAFLFHTNFHLTGILPYYMILDHHEQQANSACKPYIPVVIAKG